MPTRLAKHISTRKTPQTEPIPGQPQVKNNAGGYVYEIDKWSRLSRFLVLGSDGGTYYVSERKLTRANAAVVEACLREDGARAVKAIVDISHSGRAPKNDPAILALAIAAASVDVATRQLAYAALPSVCRIPTHLFMFLSFCKELRGWSRGSRTAVRKWYGRWDINKLAYQLVKYQSREGWTHRDVWRLAHPAGENAALARWAIGASLDARVVKSGLDGGVDRAYQPAVGDLPDIITAFESAKTASEADVIRLIQRHCLTREMIPTNHLNSSDVWSALLVSMPMTAMIRNLGKMTSVGLVKPLGDAAKMIVGRLSDSDYLRKSKVHPIAVLNAMRVYAQGRGDKGSLVWTPVQSVVDGLNDAFYGAYGNVAPTGKRIMLALDVSGSMGYSMVSGTALTAREAVAAMALVTANVEKDYVIIGFTGGTKELAISPKQRLDTVVKYMERLPFDRTDCAQPMLFAHKRKMDVDAFVIYTDNETWSGSIHPKQALAQYRKSRGIQAKQVVVATAATEFTIADPSDPLTLDVVGFDLATPAALSEFITA